MIKLKRGKEVYYLPTNTSELMLSDYLRLIEWQESKGDGIDFICALANCDKQTALDCADKWHRINFDDFRKKIAELPMAKPPKTTTLSELEGLRVKDFNRMTLGQRAFMQTAVQEVDKTYKAMAKIIAIGLAPEVYPDQDWADLIGLVEEEVLLMPAEEAVPIGFFFLSHLTIMKSDGITLSGRKVLHLFRQAVRDWLSLAFSPRSMN